jgi:hypothetical protein
MQVERSFLVIKKLFVRGISECSNYGLSCCRCPRIFDFDPGSRADSYIAHRFEVAISSRESERGVRQSAAYGALSEKRSDGPHCEPPPPYQPKIDRSAITSVVRSTRSTVTFIFTCIIGITPRWHGRPHLIKKMRSICFAPLLALARRGDQPLGAAARWRRRGLLTSDVGRRAYQPASRSSRFPAFSRPRKRGDTGLFCALSDPEGSPQRITCRNSRDRLV